MANRTMINEIDILHESHCGDLTCHSGEKTAGLLCVVSYHHKIVIELREYGYYPFADSLVCPCGRPSVLLIQPIRDFKRDIGNIEKILLDFGTEVSLVSKHHAVMIFPTHIIKIMEIVDACRCHVIRMDDIAYTTDSMELISIGMYALRCEISPVRGSLEIIASYSASFGPYVLADLYGLGINT